MNKRVICSVAIFVFAVLISGWLGVLVDSALTEQPKGETPGMGIWLLLPNLTGITLILLTKSWSEVGFKPRFKGNGKWYLTSVSIFPAVTAAVLALGAALKWIDLSALDLRLFLVTFLSSLLVAFPKNILEETLWRGFLTSRLVKLDLKDWHIYLVVGFVWGVWHLPYYLVFLPAADMAAVLPVSRAVFALVAIATMMCWTVMFVELFRVTKSLWPCALLHSVEDALVNPLILSGFIAIAAGKEILVSPVLGVIPSLLYLAVGLGIRAYRTRANRMVMGTETRAA